MMVGMIADEAGVVVVHEPEGSVIERQSENRHIIGVHDSMRETDGLPLRDEACRARDDFSKKFDVAVIRADEVRKMLLNNVVRQPREVVHLAAIIEDLK